jgi:phosphatidylglycerophosphate synthase
MEIGERYKATIIGSIFSATSFILTFTYIIPILSVSVLGALVESMMSLFINDDPYSNIGKATIAFLVVFLALIITRMLLESRKNKLSNSIIILFMIVTYLIIHPLGFYIYWAISMNFKSDGQLIFGAVSSFPFSSLSFIALGLLIDLVKKAP